MKRPEKRQQKTWLIIQREGVYQQYWWKKKPTKDAETEPSNINKKGSSK